MKANDIIITEAVRARIDHPEDWVWQRGSSGYNSAISALDYAQQNPSDITLKYDGTPSLIVGRNDSGQLVVTDKSGFGAKRYNGRPTDAKSLYQMLYSRKPADVGRDKYSATIASLWNLFEVAIPKTVRGYYQGDLLYVGTPKTDGENFVFTPNKVTYSVPVSSALGKRISTSKAGIVFHSFFKNENQAVPENITDVSTLANNPQLFVISASIPNANISPINAPKYDFSGIDTFLDPLILKSKNITVLPSLVGNFINTRAREGKPITKSVPVDFVNWLPLSKATVEKQDNIKQYIEDNSQYYIELWKAILIVTAFKNNIKSQLDNSQTNSQISATLNGEPNHEGYVVDTPSGKIKLVDRYTFMAPQNTKVDDTNEN